MEFITVRGVCRPETFEALDVFKGIQREVNRVLDASNKDLIFVDGRIGEKTIAAVNATLNTHHKDCASIAVQAKLVLSRLKQFATSHELAVVADPESIVRSTFNPPSKLDTETGKVVHPSLVTAGIAGVPLWLVALAAGGGYYYFKTKKPKKRKSSKSLARKR